MDNIFIKGGRKMEGRLDISTAKNSLLPLLAGSIIGCTLAVFDVADITWPIKPSLPITAIFS